MKKIKQLVFICTILLSQVSFAQETKKFTKDVIPSSPETPQKSSVIRNPNASNVNIDGVIIEKRIAQYYSPGDLDKKTKAEAIKINHLYLDSYELINKNEINSSCINAIEYNFDLAGYNHLRKQNERATVLVSFNGCNFKISLFSWNEVNSLK